MTSRTHDLATFLSFLAVRYREAISRIVRSQQNLFRKSRNFGEMVNKDIFLDDIFFQVFADIDLHPIDLRSSMPPILKTQVVLS